MKGIVFVALAEMIQEKYGFKEWNILIDSSDLESKGIYTSSMTYDDLEAYTLLEKIAYKLEKPKSDILKIFGIYFANYLLKRYPQYFQHDNYFNFLMSVETYIHDTIKIISPESSPPQINVSEIEKSKIYLVKYHSKRKLCSLAIGLLKGSSKIFSENIEIEHLKCMHEGNDCCEFVLKVK